MFLILSKMLHEFGGSKEADYAEALLQYHICLQRNICIAMDECRLHVLLSAKQPGSGESQASVLPDCTDHAGDEREKETERKNQVRKWTGTKE